ncbi:hypothetical protein QE152_g6955 [Popillia japonica]|uniref:Uncharacterized protein n=1 Tax=Popillia japonica TaxID=7064 RepID=A0AAW1MIG2_POPJA
MSARSKYLVKLAIEKLQADAYVSRDYPNFKTPEVVKTLENNIFNAAEIADERMPNSMLNIEKIVDDGLIFGGQPFDASLNLPLEENSLLIDEVVPENCVLSRSNVPASKSTYVRSDLQYLDVAATVEIHEAASDISSENLEDLENISVINHASIEFDVDDPDYCLTSSNEDSEDEDEDKVAEVATEEHQRKDNEEHSRRRNRSKKACSEKWKRNRNKIKRMKGQAYLGYTRTEDGKVKHNK